MITISQDPSSQKWFVRIEENGQIRQIRGPFDSYHEADHAFTVYPDAYVRRKKRLKAVFEGRGKQLDEARRSTDRHAYGSAVTKYTRARTAWRAFRGWH